ERERDRELILERARRRVLEAPLDADREARFFGRRALALAPPRLLEVPRAERRRALARDPEDAAADLDEEAPERLDVALRAAGAVEVLGLGEGRAELVERL